MTTDPGDLILDLTCGSGAMPYQAEKWGRRWIAVDVAQVSIAIARERLITNTYPYHMLKDSPGGARRDHELDQELLPPEQRKPFDALPAGSYGHDPAKGFVVERQPRVSAATLAYGQGDERPIYHPDRTLIEKARIRVASAFTVESDSPYSSTPPGQENGIRQDADVETVLQTTGFTIREKGEPDPVTKRITDSLEIAGIGQPGRGRYMVENLAASEVTDVTHTGILVAPDGARHPAYFYIGREDEVISAVQTRNAAFAVANADPGCKYVVMVGFGRDGDAHSVGKYRPNMTILQVAANRDLQLPWGDGSDTEMADASDRIREHRERKETLEIAAEEARALLKERRQFLDSADTIATFAEEMSDFLKTSELTETRAFVHSFVKEVVVKPGRAAIVYSIPTPDDSPMGGADAAEIALNGRVMNSVQSGGPILTVDRTIFEMWLGAL